MLDAEQKMKLLISDRPWEHEPDNEEWVDATTGYKCTVWRHPTHGSLNGYVAIPKGHRLHGQGYDAFDVEVHGGLTYASEDEKTNEWVFGFDTNHHNDFAPKLVQTIMQYSSWEEAEWELKKRGTYKTFEWVKEEVLHLAQQLKLFEIKGEMK